MPFDMKDNASDAPSDPRKARLVGYTFPFLIIGAGFFFAALWASSWVWEGVFILALWWVKITYYRGLKKRFFGG